MAKVYGHYSGPDHMKFARCPEMIALHAAVTIGVEGDVWFCGYAESADVRVNLTKIAGVTLLDNHFKPGPVDAAIVKKFGKHGVTAADTTWDAVEKVIAAKKLSDHFDPNV